MDLFADANYSLQRTKVAQSLSQNWIQQLDAATVNAIPDILTAVYLDSLEDTVYPQWNWMFRAFNDLPYENVRVVILGQDPYDTGNAMGYAFGCKDTLSPSLKQIVNAIFLSFPEEYKEHKPRRTDSNMQLTHLVSQGVLLMNTALSVRHHEPSSHIDIWEPFTKGVIRALAKKEHLIWFLWGAHAQRYQHLIPNLKHKVFTAPHPVSASYNNKVWMCNHFIEANKILSPPIIWF